jgi:molecular chaperone GrpE
VDNHRPDVNSPQPSNSAGVRGADSQPPSEQEPLQGATATQEERAELRAEIERLTGELAEAKDRFLRAQAEVENFRRRTRREMQEERQFANQPLLTDLLPILDNMERAIDAASQASTDASGLLQGFEMVHLLLQSVLEKYHCRRVPAEGCEFDPTRHQALLQETSSAPKGAVTRVNQHGYQLHDRVIRPAQVVVSAGMDTGAAASGSTASVSEKAQE